MRYLRFALLGLLALTALVLGEGRAGPADAASFTLNSTRGHEGDVDDGIWSLGLDDPIAGEPVSQASLGNGKLQIHHIDVEQGDAALIISPNGQLAMIDNGRWTACSNTVGYLQSLGITSIDYHFASHYHADHIGCLDDMAAAGIGVAIACYDRGSSYGSATFTNYATTCGAKRQTLTKGQVVTLDQGAQTEVTITAVELNGAGVYSGSDENPLSVVLKVSYCAFDEVMGGDLTGVSPEPDIESVVGPQVGDVEVYKVHHLGSATSTSDNWLNATTPEVGVISIGSNSYGHPTSEALARLHSHGVHTYWTNPGSGASPDPELDKVGGTIIVEADSGPNDSYTIAGTGFVDSYDNDRVTADSDCDGVADTTDNCPAWANSDQSVPPWPVPAGDPDCDGFTDALENYVGTDPNDACGPNAWPPDFDDNQFVNMFDVNAMRPPIFNLLEGKGTNPFYSERFDLNADDFVDMFDVNAIRPPFFNLLVPCTP